MEHTELLTWFRPFSKTKTTFQRASACAEIVPIQLLCYSTHCILNVEDTLESLTGDKG